MFFIKYPACTCTFHNVYIAPEKKKNKARRFRDGEKGRKKKREKDNVYTVCNKINKNARNGVKNNTVIKKPRFFCDIYENLSGSRMERDANGKIFREIISRKVFFDRFNFGGIFAAVRKPVRESCDGRRSEFFYYRDEIILA